MRVGLTMAMAAAAVGFFTGTRRAPVQESVPHRPAATPTAGVAQAPRQADMEKLRYRGRRAEQSVALTAMATPPRGMLDAVQGSESAYDQELVRRAELRAYDGAPPTIPHAIDQHGAPACLSCHENGLSVNGKVARPLSHALFTSCTQCHVTREGPMAVSEPWPQQVSEHSIFVGLRPPQHGARAYLAAPPQLPHRSFMRERCASCHGLWSKGIATSHPARQSCTQCHALSASADQMPVMTFSDLHPVQAAP
jgi:nitrate reductase (cytochrome), electron transfer subunit